jgi:hypothetical protein
LKLELRKQKIGVKMELLQWIAQEFSDVRMPPYYIMDMLRRDVPHFRQINEKTQVQLVESRSLRFVSTSDHVLTQVNIQELTPITGWNWKGLKALGWRIWKAIINEAPTGKGYRQQWVTKTRKQWRERELEAQAYGFQVEGWSWRFYACYDGEQDILFVLESWKEPIPFGVNWSKHA